MDPGDVLMREILAHPDDDAPRVVYADWLLQQPDDESHARAALIHAQCALETASAAERPELFARARAVLQLWRRKWTAGLTRARVLGSWRFRRGFLDAGTLGPDRFCDTAHLVFRHAPMVRAIVFPSAANELVRLSKFPSLARLDDVDLHEMCRCGYCKTERELPYFFASPYTASIRRLNLRACLMKDESAIELGASPHLRGLRELDLSENQLGAGGAAAVAQLGPNLRVLSLANNPIGDGGAKAIAAADLQLSHLDLSRCELGESAARALADSTWADSLVSLDLRTNKLGKGAARAALRARFGARLAL